MDKIVHAVGAIDVQRVLLRVIRAGATSVPVLDDATRAALVREAHEAHYEPQPEVLPGGVREELTSCEQPDPNGTCAHFARILQEHINNATARLSVDIFSRPIVFDEVVIQRYAAGSAGITPHRDFAKSIDLICVLVIDGIGRFCLCDDRAGTNPREIRALPGDLIVMRGPGFMGSNFRPFHFLDNIQTQRFTLGMRCNKQEKP